MQLPRRVILAVALGLLVLGGVTFECVRRLQSRVLRESLEERGARIEASLRDYVRSVARERLAAQPSPTLPALARDLILGVRANPAVVEAAVVDRDCNLVRGWRRDGRHDCRIACVTRRPLDRTTDHEHPPGTLEEYACGCVLMPLAGSGSPLGGVLLHTARDWRGDSDLAARSVTRAALYLAPIFAAFYLLLGVLLVAAHRQAARWRRRAAAAERVEALGALADGINHEIRNPLNAVALSFQYLERRADDEEMEEVVGSARKQTERIAKTLDGFFRFASVTRLRLEEADVAEILRHGVDAAEDGAEIRVDAEIPGVRARVDVEKMRDAFRAIAAFLREYAPAGAEIRLALTARSSGWRLRAEGPAPGLDPEVVGRLFDPYVRVRPRDVARGLALARAVLQAHGGDLGARHQGGTLVLEGGAPERPPEGAREESR